MATLIFDIETEGQSWDDLPVAAQVSLTNWVDRSDATGEAADKMRQRVKHDMSLSPFTGSITALTLWDAERETGAVYVVHDSESVRPVGPRGFSVVHCTEKELLEAFWDGARSYNLFVTFAGRTFDVPFLLHRSAAHEIRPTVDLAKSKYLAQQTAPYHIDLQDECMFYNALSRRPSLPVVCAAYDIPLETDPDLPTHTVHKITATAAVYSRWYRYLAPKTFLHIVESL